MGVTGILVRCEDCGERFDSCDLSKVCTPCKICRKDVFEKIKEQIQQDPSLRVKDICEELGLSERVTAFIIKKDREETDAMKRNAFRGMIRDSMDTRRW